MWQTLYFAVTQSTRNRSKTIVKTDKEDSEVRVLTDSEVQTIVNVGKTMEENTDSEVQEKLKNGFMDSSPGLLRRPVSRWV
jgi:hypothetical protein